MTLDRRRFLVTTGISLAGGLAPARSFAAAAATVTPPPDPADWASVRAQFELSRDYIHLATFYISSHPRPVREAIETHRKAIDANPYLVVERAVIENRIAGEVPAAAAEYLGGKPEEVALTGNTTTGLALVYRGLPLGPGQEILTTTHEHYSHHESIRLAAQRAGATVRKIALYDDGAAASQDEIVDRIRRQVRPATRAVGVTWVHSSTGVKLPIRRIAEAFADLNRGRDEKDRALLIVDGLHGFGVEDETVARMGCDFFVSGTHKWIFGPRGTGIVWAPERVWGSLSPTIPAFAMEPYEAWLEGKQLPGPMKASWISPGGFHAYEHQWALPAAFRFHQQIGRERVAQRTHALNDMLKEGLARLPHVRLRTPRGSRLSAGIVCFDVQGMKPGEVVRRLLERRIVGSETPYAPSYVRLAANIVNTPEEIETTLSAVKGLA